MAFLTALALDLDPASPQALAARGARKVGDLTVSADTLERWAEARREAQGKPLAEDVLSALGWTEDQAKQVAAALKKTAPKMAKPERAERIVRDSPFAALAGTKPASSPTARHRPRRWRKASPP